MNKPLHLFPIFLLALLLLNIAPSNCWLDSSGLTAGSFLLGINHPPGEPLYTMLSKLFLFIPIGSIAFRMNLFSALLLVVSYCLFYRIFIRVWDRELIPLERFIVLVSGLLVFLSWSFMIQGVRAELYSMNLFLSLLIVYAFTHRNTALLGFFVFGLSLGCHHLLTFALIPGLFFLLNRERKLSFYAKAFMFLIIGFSVYLYLPLRAHCDPLYSFGRPDNIERFWWVFSGKLYSAYKGIDAGVIYENLRKIISLFIYSIPLVSGLGLAGILIFIFKRFKYGAAFLLILLSNLVLLIVNMQFYDDNPDAHGYMMIAMCVLGLGLPIALFTSFNMLKETKILTHTKAVLLSIGVLLLLFAVSKAFLTAKSYDKSKDYSARLFAVNITGDIPYGSVIVTGSFTTYSIAAYKVWCESYRKDIVLLYSGLFENDGYIKSLESMNLDIFKASRQPFRFDSKIMEGMSRSGRGIFIELAIKKDGSQYGIRFADEILGSISEHGWFFKYSPIRQDKSFEDYKYFWEKHIFPFYEGSDPDFKRHIMLGLYLHSRYFVARGQDQKARYLISQGIKLNPSFEPFWSLDGGI